MKLLGRKLIMLSGVTFPFLLEEHFWEFKHVQISTISRKSSLISTSTYQSIYFIFFFLPSKLLEQFVHPLFSPYKSSTHHNLLPILPSKKFFLLGPIVRAMLLNLVDSRYLIYHGQQLIASSKKITSFVFCDPLHS